MARLSRRCSVRLTAPGWLLAALLGTVAAPAGAETESQRATRELTALLAEFLDGASRNDAGVHERFWAEDLIYTSSAGRRTDKAEILAGLRAGSPTPGETPVVYTAEDVRIQAYGDVAVVAFRLVGTTGEGSGAARATYLNTGTFLRRQDQWRAIAWQATKEAAPEPERPAPARDAAVNLTPGAVARPGLADEIRAADAAFFRAFFDTCDLDALRRLVADDFEMIHDKSGRAITSGDGLVRAAADKCRRQAEGTDFTSTRTLVPESFAVYPINDYGAIETGLHRFHAVKPGEPDRLTETGRFTIVWQEQDGQWRAARALSYDHVLATP